MTDKERIAFRMRLAEYLESLTGYDAEKNMRSLVALESWLDSYINIKVSEGIRPFIKLKKS